jgi:hypothetical protein
MKKVVQVQVSTGIHGHMKKAGPNRTRCEISRYNNRNIRR